MNMKLSMPYHRKRGILRTKSHEKHSDTLVSTIGPGTATVTKLVVRETEQGDRDPTGATDTIQLGRGNNEECNQGDTCKYVNLHMQAGPRVVGEGNAINNGWLEWAFVCKKASDPEPTTTNTGTNTLGDVCTKYFRNECIYTGNFPIGGQQPNSAEVTIKIPKTKATLRTGDEWALYYIIRTVSATETATNSFRVITSFNYINYH